LVGVVFWLVVVVMHAIPIVVFGSGFAALFGAAVLAAPAFSMRAVCELTVLFVPAVVVQHALMAVTAVGTTVLSTVDIAVAASSLVLGVVSVGIVVCVGLSALWRVGARR